MAKVRHNCIPLGEGSTPPDCGVYVAYVNSNVGTALTEHIFLTWDGECWYYPMSDQRYRGYVYQWVGPLPVLRLTE